MVDANPVTTSPPNIDGQHSNSINNQNEQPSLNNLDINQSPSSIFNRQTSPGAINLSLNGDLGQLEEEKDKIKAKIASDNADQSSKNDDEKEDNTNMASGGENNTNNNLEEAGNSDYQNKDDQDEG